MDRTRRGGVPPIRGVRGVGVGGGRRQNINWGGEAMGCLVGESQNETNLKLLKSMSISYATPPPPFPKRRSLRPMVLMRGLKFMRLFL
jgi:hypothetical protein